MSGLKKCFVFVVAAVGSVLLIVFLGDILCLHDLRSLSLSQCKILVAKFNCEGLRMSVMVIYVPCKDSKEEVKEASGEDLKEQ